MIAVQPGSDRVCRATATLLSLALFVTPLGAQTDFYNTDAGRPIRIEDAYPTERYAFEMQLAPVRLERGGPGQYRWGVEPEVAYGILPRTHIEVGLPLAYVDVEGLSKRAGMAGIAVSLLHNLNVETAGVPALAVLADVLLPAGRFAPARTYPSLTGIATRTYRWARFHVNAQYTFGARTAVDGASSVDAGSVEVSRWLGGLAVDKTFPLRSMLVTSELYARQPILTGAEVEWNAGAGIRYQLLPQWAIDGGLGRRLTGEERSWYVTFGTAYAFALPSFMPGRRGPN